jgi:hypothetical protein
VSLKKRGLFAVVSFGLGSQSKPGDTGREGGTDSQISSNCEIAF